MKNILNKIIIDKKKEIENDKLIFPINKLEHSLYFNREIFSLKKKILHKDIFIIAEFKLKSPSKGIINNNVIIENVIKDYTKSNISGISILTNYNFFYGKKNDLQKARVLTYLPLLRKDFIIDEYQIIESKSIGADIILLIANILSKKEVNSFSMIAKNIGLEIILEIYDEKDIDKINDDIDFIGINSRNLSNFKINNKQRIKLCNLISNNYIKIAESGINNIEDVINLQKCGFRGFLIGEYFMRHKNPGKFCKSFVDNIKHNEKQNKSKNMWNQK